MAVIEFDEKELTQLSVALDKYLPGWAIAINDHIETYFNPLTGEVIGVVELTSEFLRDFHHELHEDDGYWLRGTSESLRGKVLNIDESGVESEEV